MIEREGREIKRGEVRKHRPHTQHQQRNSGVCFLVCLRPPHSLARWVILFYAAVYILNSATLGFLVRKHHHQRQLQAFFLA